jgi:hypothetical protein
MMIREWMRRGYDWVLVVEWYKGEEVRTGGGNGQGREML